MNKDAQQLPLFELTSSNKKNQKELIGFISSKKSAFSKYTVYVDESGDHNLKGVNKDYPIFVLAFCVFHKRHYSESIVPALEKFKFNYFGHDQVILHEHAIRKETGDFNIFRDRKHKEMFLDELTQIIDYSNFILISCTIDKRQLSNPSNLQTNPYHVALGYCIEALYEFLKEKQETKKETHVVFECRGYKEDKDLELEFRRICDGQNSLGIQLPFKIIFSDKKAMSSGLQLADLVARPIGLKTLRPEQKNRSFDVLKKKFYCEYGRKGAGENFEGKGMKVYPRDKNS